MSEEFIFILLKCNDRSLSVSGGGFYNKDIVVIQTRRSHIVFIVKDFVLSIDDIERPR